MRGREEERWRRGSRREEEERRGGEKEIWGVFGRGGEDKKRRV